MIRYVFRFWFAFAVSLALMAGCSEDGGEGGSGGTGGEGGLVSVPDIPLPTSYLDVDVPTKSQELVVETVVLSEFTPSPLRATNQVHRTDSNILCEDDDPNDEECGCWPVVPVPNGIDSPPIVLVEDEEIVPDPEANRCEYYTEWAASGVFGSLPSGTFVAEANNVKLKPLSSQPRLQLVRYWILNPTAEGGIGCWYVPGGTADSVSWTETKGTTETNAQTFGETIGVSVGASDPWGALTAALTSEFSSTTSSSIAVYRETTETRSRSVPCPVDKECVYCIWQLVEEYRYVDANGDLFMDPNYEWFLRTLPWEPPAQLLSALGEEWEGELVLKNVVPKNAMFEKVP